MNRAIDLSHISEDQLLNLRIKDLSLKLEGTWVEGCIDQLYKELDHKGIKFKPACYLADEWLTPDQEPIIGVPFFLAHSTLMKLEQKMMLEVEGGTHQWCMKLLRHEAGHALNYAYRLFKRKKWQKYFGQFSLEYLDTYRFRPYSKNFVRHLEEYYAQYHPDEDFAETFAVWLTPDLDWKTLYKGQKALAKLQVVDELINSVKEKSPQVKKGKKYWHLPSLKIKLSNYYKKKKHYYAEDFPDFHDVNLRRIFVERNQTNSKLPLAHKIINSNRNNILNSISSWTGERKYVVNELLKKIVKRLRELKLVSGESEVLIVLRISTYITTLVMNYMYTGRFRGKKCVKK